MIRWLFNSRSLNNKDPEVPAKQENGFNGDRRSRAKQRILESDNELHDAAFTGNLAQVQSLSHNYDINARGEYGRTALWKAASEGHMEVVKLLLTLNADVNIPNVSTLISSAFTSSTFPSLYLTLYLFSTFLSYVLFSRTVE